MAQVRVITSSCGSNGCPALRNCGRKAAKKSMSFGLLPPRMNARPNSLLKRGMIDIMATDISDSVLAQARSGSYDKIAVNRGLSPEYRARYFTDEGRLWSIAPAVKELVKFEKFNLQDPFSKLGAFDIIFCRNVAIYFSEKFKRELFAKHAGILTRGGILFLGSSESISLYSNEYDMLEHNRGIYYRVRK